MIVPGKSSMTETIETLLVLLAVLVAVAVLARRLQVAPSILLVIAGISLALVPGLPSIELAPELVLLVMLPPLLYSAAVAMSWREFRFNLRPIFLLAFGAVVFTTCAVAAAAHYVLGLPWAVGFLLGAIVSPPDAVAPLAVARKLHLPRRLLLVLEGEGVANDATALILYRFAVVAISTGTFSFGQAAGAFAAIVVGEIIWGIVVGWVSLRVRRWAGEPRVEITLSLMTPYLAYWIPEHLGGSGVLAAVSAGLYVSWRGPLLIPSAAGNLLLGLDHLSHRRLRLPRGRPAGPHFTRTDRSLFPARSRHGGGAHHGDRDRGTLHLGLSGGISAALAQPVAGQA
jgi:monovalent cation/hydrogen antiporter